jgi:hypothetical protein
MTSDPSFIAEIETIANQLSLITADSQFSDVLVAISPTLERQYWNDTNRAANFLKHADRDTDGILPLEKLNTRLLLIKCSCAYQDVAPDDLGNEGLVFQAFVAANNPAYQVGDTSFDSMVVSMQKMPAERQSATCYKIIRDMNAKE